jgi:carboxyl-terminal processing protease
MRSRKRLGVVLSVVFLLFLLVGTCCSSVAWGGKRLLNRISFEIAWRVVNDRYFDPTFGGLDWQGVHDRYRRQVTFAGGANYYRLVNEMLWQLDVSHLAVVPANYWPMVEPTVMAGGSTGLDVRLLDGEAVVTAVEPGSPAAGAGLRPGHVLLSIDGAPVAELAAETEAGLAPPDNERSRVEAITSDLLAHLYGPPGSDVTLVYLDEQGRQWKRRVERRSRPGKTATAPGFPANYVTFESRRLAGGIGYIRFNWFHAELAETLPRTIASMHDAPGLIIDLRGNPGGMRQAAIAGAAQLVGERTRCSTLTSRDGTRDIVLEPAGDGYQGPVVVLIDVMSKSSSEFFAACTQSIGRSVVVGERSPGSVGPAEIMALPNGATFIYPVARETTLDGTVLEGHGVIPDIDVALDRALLAQGIDSQLKAAVGYLQGPFQEAR